MTYIKKILIAIDQVGNALADGNPKRTISGRTGYYQYNAIKPFRLYWRLLAFIIDATFYPLDSHSHCRKAYENEKDKEFTNRLNLIALVVLSFITIGSCLILAPIFWTIYGIKALINRIKLNV